MISRTFAKRFGRGWKGTQQRVRQIRSLIASNPLARDACAIGLVVAIAYVIARQAEIGRKFFRFVVDHPDDNIDDPLILALALGVGAALFSIRRVRELRREIAARQAAEYQANAAVALLEDAVESISEGFVIFDQDDRLVMCNQQYRNIYYECGNHVVPGVTFEEILRLSLRYYKLADSMEAQEAFVAQRLFEHRQAVGNVEYRRADGNWLLVTERRMRNGGIAGLRINITALKASQAAMMQSEERLDRAQEIAGIGSWEFDVAADRYIWSKQMYRLRGLPSDTFEPTSSAVAAYVHPDDEPSIRRFRDDLSAGIPREPIEARFIRPSGEVRVLRYEARPVIDVDGVIRRVSGTAQDVTERRLMERQLAQSQKMEMIGQFAGGTAHDFNNVLGIIIGNLELLQDYTEGNALAEELRTEALSGALHGADLTRRLLAFARRQPLRPTRINMNELIQSTSKLLVRLLGEHLQLNLDLHPGLWPVSADSAQLEAALTNLVSNARDAMDHAGTLTITTRNLCVDNDCATGYPELALGDYVLVEVVDTGGGIPADVIGHIFDPFFTTKIQGKGSGLGLSMVFGFIKQSGGHVAVRSQPDVGTAFSLYLPRCADHELELSRADSTPLRIPESGGRETVLVVEDNTQLRRSTVRHLVQLGYRVFEASDAEAALTILKINQGVEMLFSDVVMPGAIDGIDLVEQVRTLRRGLPCLLTSGYSDLAGREHRLQTLRCRLLSKPYQYEELARAIRHAMDQPDQIVPERN